MLKHLWIKDYIIMDEISLDFRTGMSAFTGETGAGKSILIDALAILCGARVSGSVVRNGKDKAIIEGVFSIRKKEALQILQDAGIGLEDEYIITREINREGKSIARINHRVVNSSLLKQVLEGVIDIHNQRDNQYLLNSKLHINLLDHYHGNTQLLQDIYVKYKEYSSLLQELNLAKDTELNKTELEFLQFQIQEIESLNLIEGEYEQLENKQKQMESFEKVNQILNESKQLLNAQAGIIESFHRVNNHLSSVDIDEINSFHERSSSLYYEITDLSDAINHFHAQLEFDENELNRIQERLFTIHRLMRKHGNSEKDIFNALSSMKEKINLIENRQEYIQLAEQKVILAYQEFEKLAMILHSIRSTAAAKLSKEIVIHLHDLELPYANFEIEILKTTPNSTGLNSVIFKISMNKGETLKPLAQVASGGELSRLMLGLKTIFSRLQGIETIIFDEIDTGVSGKTATMIGVKMRSLAHNTQVFTVTHLAQVAAYSEYHYFVSKDQSGDNTKTIITELSTSQRIEQLALISTGTTTPTAIESAKELLFSSQNLLECKFLKTFK